MKFVSNRGGQEYKLDQQNSIFLLFIIFVASYVTLIILFANFSVIDDHTLTQTLFINKKIPWFISSENGRFYPLDAIDLNILSALFKPNAYIFYTFNAILAIILVTCVYKSSNLILIENKLAYICVITILISPAFITSFLRLFVPEKLESIFFAIFILSYTCFLHNKNQKLCFIIAIISANIALYFKETAFILLGCMAFFHLIFTLKNNNNRQKILDFLLFISSGIWLIVYFVIVIMNKTTDARYGDTPFNQYIVLIKNTISYILSEPFLFIGIPALIIFRIFLIIFRKNKINPLIRFSSPSFIYTPIIISSSKYILISLPITSLFIRNLPYHKLL